jgi:hypothetical protein
VECPRAFPRNVCTTGDGCAPPLFCVADATGISGTCVKKLPGTGAICDQAIGCDDYRDVCNASNVCVRRGRR